MSQVRDDLWRIASRVLTGDEEFFFKQQVDKHYTDIVQEAPKPPVTRYVAGFLIHGGKVALVQKNRPKWQAGKWNGIGGHIEVGETDADAMRREFREETGVDLDRWEHFATLHGEGFEVVFYRILLDRFQQPLELRTLTDERVAWVWADDFEFAEPIPNLHWLVPMAMNERPGRGMPYTIHEAAPCE